MNCSNSHERRKQTIVFPPFASYLLVLSVLQNASIFGPFRLIDIWIWSVFFIVSVRYSHFSRNYLLWALILFTFAIASSLTGTILHGMVSPTMFVFYYKYATLFVALFLVYLVTTQELLFKCSYWQVLFYCVVVYLSLYVITFIYSNPLSIANSASRVSVPFSKLDANTSNSPMFSIVLALLALASIRGLQASNIIKLSLFILSACAMLLTGSRSGFFIMMLFGLSYFIRASLKNKLFCIVTGIVLLMTANLFLDGSLAKSLFDRSIDFNFASDQSANDRLSKQIYAINDVFTNILWLGLGHENTAILWYDGIIGNILIMFGFWGASIFIFSLTFYFYKLTRATQFSNNSAKPAYFVGMILLASLISEFILTSYPLGIILFISIVLTTPPPKKHLR